MKFWSLAIAVLLAAPCAVTAHFLFVVPQPGGEIADVFLSEDLEPTTAGTEYVAAARLAMRAADGRDISLELRRKESRFSVELPADRPGVVHGFADLGIMQRGEPHLLHYHPKTVLGDPFRESALIGDVPAEMVPVGRPGSAAIKALASGEPLAGAEVTVLFPDGSSGMFETDAGGMTPRFDQLGRFGAWFGRPLRRPGERDGKAYGEIRHYATLVFEIGASPSDVEGTSGHGRALPAMPEAAASFGAAVLDGWLYVYGGHVAPAHEYHREAVSGRFSRIRLDGTSGWEPLPSGRGLQGMNLAVHAGAIYRVGGMEPRNGKGESSDIRSVAECARYVPASGEWETVVPMPGPRSSHDVVVLGDRLFVVGGWDLGEAGPVWSDHMLVLDLSSKDAGWQRIPQPFKRRALMAAAHQGSIYVVGGFGEQGQVVRNVSVYDPSSGNWSEAPELTGEGSVGFSPAVGAYQGRLFASVSDGRLLRLNAAGSAWEAIGQATGRVAHRLAFQGGRVIVIGGSAGGKMLDLLEAIELPAGG